MTHHDADLDRLTKLLGQCLGRIDEQAYQLQRNADEDDFEASDVLERETALLQEIVSSVIEHANRAEDADLNPVVERTLHGTVAEFGRPVVVSTDLAQDLPRVACSPGQLVRAVQRALKLMLGPIAAGGSLRVTSRLDDGSVLLEIESIDTETDGAFDERSATLREYVEELGGSCCSNSDGRGTCLIALQLPVALVRDES